MLVDPLGVLGTASVRELRAVRGVGALMRDFFGVSVTLVLRLPRFDDAVCSSVFATSSGVVTAPATAPARPPETMCVAGEYIPDGLRNDLSCS